MVLLLRQLEKVLAKLALQAHAVVEVRHRLAAYFFVKYPDFGLFKCIDLKHNAKPSVTWSMCEGCKVPEEGGLYRNDFLLLHFKNKLGPLSVPCVGIDSASSALEINGTARSMSTCPRDLGGVSAQYCTVCLSWPELFPPHTPFFFTVNFRGFRPLRSFCLGTKENHGKKLTLALESPDCPLLHT